MNVLGVFKKINRDKEERKILLEFTLQQIEERDEDKFVVLSLDIEEER
jgi:hypothetical protein